jgi:hypothetical protein
MFCASSFGVSRNGLRSDQSDQLLAMPIPNHSARPCRWISHPEWRLTLDAGLPRPRQRSNSGTAPSLSPSTSSDRLAWHPRQPVRSRRRAITISLPVPKSPLSSPHRRCPTSRDFVPWRFSDAGHPTAWLALSMPASEKPAQKRLVS